MEPFPGADPANLSAQPTWPILDDEIRAAVQAALVDGSWGRYTGCHVQALEGLLAAYHFVPHVQACASGTLAVELALHAVGVRPGDEVVLSAYDYPGNFLTIHALGAVPVLVDVAPGSVEPTGEAIANAVGPQCRAVLVSHLHGALADMPAIADACKRTGVALVEDACQGCGANAAGRKAGSWGDAGVLSFGGSKLLTAGRGGAILTARPDVAQRVRQRQFRGNIVGPLSELQAAVLEPQLAKLDERNQVRRRAVKLLVEQLADVPGLQPVFSNAIEATSAFYKVGFLLDESRFGMARAALVAMLRAEGVAMDEGFQAAHVGRSMRRFRAAGPLVHAERAGREVVILHHPVLLCGPDAIGQVAGAIQKAQRAATVSA
jgi:perosamine synthetase